MALADTAEAEPAVAAVKPRKLGLNAAIDQYERCQFAIDGLTPLRDEARKVILAHSERTGRMTYKGRVAVYQTGGGVILDQGSVRVFLESLGRLAEFQTRSKVGHALKLLRR